MAAYFESTGLSGSAAWMRKQATEEVSRAMKISEYVVARDGRVTLAAIDQPTIKFASPLKVWEAALKQEQGLTARINSTYTMASAEKDYATVTILQWFVTEQVDEEKTAKGIVDQVNSFGPTSSADRHLGKDAAKSA